MGKLEKIQAVRGVDINTRKKLGDIIKGGKRRKRTRKRRGGEKCPKVRPFNQFKRFAEDNNANGRMTLIKETRRTMSNITKIVEWTYDDDGRRSSISRIVTN